MKSLLPRLEAVSAFGDSDENALTEIYDSDRHRYLSKNGVGLFVCGGFAQHERRAKLDQAMRQVVKCVDDMCARYDDAVIRNKDASPLSKGMTIGVRHAFQNAMDNLAAVVASMEKGGEACSGECPYCDNVLCVCAQVAEHLERERTQKETGAREWWIDVNEWLLANEGGMSGHAFTREWLDDMEMSEASLIHVIEHAAFLAERAAREKAEAERDDYMSQVAGLEDQSQKNLAYAEHKLNAAEARAKELEGALAPQKIDQIVCGWSMNFGVALSESQLNALVDMLALAEADKLEGER